jgi:hypothetical protein
VLIRRPGGGDDAFDLLLGLSRLGGSVLSQPATSATIRIR